jgi:protein O-mannosyl-transferase
MESKSILTRCGLLALAASLPFTRGMTNPWIWDDALVLGKRLAPAACGGLGELWRQSYWGSVGPADTYRPLSLSFLYLERTLFGEVVMPYHLVSLGLHAIVSMMVMVVVGRLAGRAIGWTTALIFAVHPVHAEAVGMVYGQLELISGFFVLLTVALYIEARREGFRPFPFALALLSAACAMCSKESALMLPALLMLVRATWLTGGDDRSEKIRRFFAGLEWDLLFLVAAVPYIVLRYRALGGLAPDPDATVTLGYTLNLRIKTMVVSLGHAMQLCTVPTGQGLYYGYLRDSVFGRPYAEMIWILAALVVIFQLASELGRRVAFFGVGWFLLTFLPVSNIIPTGVLVAERTLYLPSLGVCFLFASAIEALVGRAMIAPAVGRSALGCLLLVYALASTLVVGNWRDEETLWLTTVVAHPRSPFAHLYLCH